MGLFSSKPKQQGPVIAIPKPFEVSQKPYKEFNVCGAVYRNDFGVLGQDVMISFCKDLPDGSYWFQANYGICEDSIKLYVVDASGQSIHIGYVSEQMIKLFKGCIKHNDVWCLKINWFGGQIWKAVVQCYK